MNQKLSKFQNDYILNHYNFRFHHNCPQMCFYMVKKNYVKKTENDDIITRFWYTLKNLDPFEIPLKHIIFLNFRKNLTIKLFQVA